MAICLAITACGGGTSIDNTNPTVSISSSDTNTSSVVTFKFVFSEPVAGFKSENVLVTGGSQSPSVTQISPTVYTLTVTPTTGPISATVNANQFFDLASNPNLISATYIYTTTISPFPTALVNSVDDNVSPLMGLVASGGTTDDTTPTLRGTLSAKLSGGQLLRVYDGSQLLGTATVTAQTWTYTTTAQRSGSHVYKAVVVSSDGTEGELSAGFAITIATSTIATVKLTDTGIPSHWCYAVGSGYGLVSCTSPEAISLNDQQDGMVGLDVISPNDSDGKLGFSYSKVGNYPVTDCVKDNVTGLIWEGKTTDGGLRDASNYAWPNALTNYGDGRSRDTSAYVAAVNATQLCGYTDWRLPTFDELQSLANFSSGKLDTVWFPNTPTDTYYWSSSPYAANSNQSWLSHLRGWSMFFGRDGSAGVMLVRSIPLQAQVKYTYSENGAEVTDTRTGLIWRRCSEGQIWNGVTCTGLAAVYTHEQSLALAKTQNGWRLPNIKELSSLADRNIASPTIDIATFPNTPGEKYWSSTPWLSSSYYDDWAWYIGFDDGSVSSTGKAVVCGNHGECTYDTYRSSSLHIRLVR